MRRRWQLDCHIWENASQVSVRIEQERSIKAGAVVQEENTGRITTRELSLLSRQAQKIRSYSCNNCELP